MPQWNIQTVRAIPDLDLAEIADPLGAATDLFIQRTRAIARDTEVRWYAGKTIPVQVAACMRLAEAVIHGFDIATATGEKWPIDADDADHLLRAWVHRSLLR